MTADGPLGERPAGNLAPVAAVQLLDLCDRLLGEIGRRRHMFGWLRAPDSERWVAVDAYYPGNRLVVVCRDASADEDELIAARVPEHGLRLLRLAPAGVLADPAGVVGALERALDALAPAPARRPVARPTATATGPSPVARAVASLAPPPRATRPAAEARPLPHRLGPSQAEAAARAARFVAAHPVARRTNGPTARAPRPTPPRRPVARRTATATARVPARPALPSQNPAGRLRATVAAALAIVLTAEVYFGVIRLALDGGHVLLAFGIALDTCARAFGTIAAGRASDRASAWWCALGGSPFVAGFALYGPDGPVEVDPAPLAGLMALFACGMLAIGLVAAALGG